MRFEPVTAPYKFTNLNFQVGLPFTLAEATNEPAMHIGIREAPPAYCAVHCCWATSVEALVGFEALFELRIWNWYVSPATPAFPTRLFMTAMYRRPAISWHW